MIASQHIKCFYKVVCNIKLCILFSVQMYNCLLCDASFFRKRIIFTIKITVGILKNPGNQANEKYFGLQVQLKVHGFNNLTHSRFTNIVGFYNGLVDNKHLCWVSCQDHLLTSLLMQLHHGHNMLTDNSQSLLYGGSRISPRAFSLFVSGCLYVINSAPAHWQTSPSIT